MRRLSVFVIAALILCLLLVYSGEPGKTRVTLFIPFSDSLDIEIVRNQLRTFETNNPHIRVDLTPEPYRHYDEKLQMMAASGGAPDVFAVDVFHAPFFRHIAQPLDGFWQGDPISDDFDPRLIDTFRFYRDNGDSRLYGLPRSIDSLGLFYNVELFAQRGLDAPENWNDLRQKVRELTNRDLDTYGIAFGDATASFLAFAIANGAPCLIETNTNEALINVGSDEAIGALEFYLELQGNSPSLPWVVGTEGAEQAFVRGQVAMILEGTWSSRYIRNMNPSLDYSIARLPRSDTGGYGNLLFATVYSIANQTGVPEESWELVKFLIGEESQRLWLESGIGLPFHRDLQNLFLEEYPLSEDFYEDMYVAKLYSFDRIGSLYIPEVERAIKRATEGNEAPDEALGHAVEEIRNAL